MSPRRFWIALAVLFSLNSWQLLHALENGTALSSAPSAPVRRSPCVPFILGGLLVGTILVGGHRFLCPGRHPPATLPATDLPVDLTTETFDPSSDTPAWIVIGFICSIGIVTFSSLIGYFLFKIGQSVYDVVCRPVDRATSTSQADPTTSTTTAADSKP